MATFTVTTVFVTLAVMIAVCAIVLHNAAIITISALAASSVNVSTFVSTFKLSLIVQLGTFGLSVLFGGVALDSVTSAAALLCVGMSIDLVVHTIFHYNRNARQMKDGTHQKHLLSTLHHIGRPTIQAAVTTILPTPFLFAHGAQIYRTFAALMISVALCGNDFTSFPFKKHSSLRSCSRSSNPTCCLRCAGVLQKPVHKETRRQKVIQHHVTKELRI